MDNKIPEPQISLLTWMLEDVRSITLKGVEHLTKEQLFETPIEGEYSIGSYLMHLAEVDIYWLEVLSGNPQPEVLKKRSYYNVWFDSLEESLPPNETLEISEYLDVIAATRKNFLDHIAALKDSDLEEVVIQQGRTKEHKLTKKWIVYHILEHEAHHRGQMFMLIRKAGWKKT